MAMMNADSGKKINHGRISSLPVNTANCSLKEKIIASSKRHRVKAIEKQIQKMLIASSVVFGSIMASWYLPLIMDATIMVREVNTANTPICEVVYMEVSTGLIKTGMAWLMMVPVTIIEEFF